MGVTESAALRRSRGGYRREERERRRDSSAGAVAVSGPSLVDGKNNSRAADDDDDDRYDCRVAYRAMELEAEDGETAAFRCNSWDCYCCAHRMRMNLTEELDRLVEERPELRRFLTLTLNPATAPVDSAEQHRFLTERFNALRTELNDRYDGLSYVWVREEGESGNPHLHLIVDRFLPQAELSKLAERVGLGEVVDIRRVNARNMARYLTKYLTKGSLASLPEGIRRYGSSADIDLEVRGGDGDSRDWELLVNDWQITDRNGEPLRRAVVSADFVQHRQWNGPVPPDTDLGG